jgi:hypothetical protein
MTRKVNKSKGGIARFMISNLKRIYRGACNSHQQPALNAAGHKEDVLPAVKECQDRLPAQRAGKRTGRSTLSFLYACKDQFARRRPLLQAPLITATLRRRLRTPTPLFHELHTDRNPLDYSDLGCDPRALGSPSVLPDDLFMCAFDLLFSTRAFCVPILGLIIPLVFMGHIGLMFVTAITVGSSAVPAFKWNQRWFGKPLALEAIALILIVPASALGLYTREALFIWCLPNYAQAVEQIKVELPVSDFHKVEKPTGFWNAGVVLLIEAERADDNRVAVEFVTRHFWALDSVSGLIYMSDDDSKSDFVDRLHIRYVKRLRPCWFRYAR